MAGIIVGNDTATSTVGIAPKAKVTSVKVGNADGAADVSQMIAAIDWVVANRNHDPANPIRVLNLSYGSGGTPSSASDPLQFAVEQAWKAGIVVVVAAGNDGNSSSLLNDPATDPYVVAVGASSTKGTTATADDELASFANLSTSARTADILAPGDGIGSLRDPGSNIDTTYPAARIADTLFRGSGTSQAAAVASATVALLLQQRPSLTPDQVKKLLTSTGTPIKVGTGAAKGLKELNLGAAISAAAPATTQSFTASSGTGSVEAARGANHVSLDGVALTGDRSIFGPFVSATWAAKAASRTAWSGDCGWATGWPVTPGRGRTARSRRADRRPQRPMPRPRRRQHHQRRADAAVPVQQHARAVLDPRQRRHRADPRQVPDRAERPDRQRQPAGDLGLRRPPHPDVAPDRRPGDRQQPVRQVCRHQLRRHHHHERHPPADLGLQQDRRPALDAAVRVEDVGRGQLVRPAVERRRVVDRPDVAGTYWTGHYWSGHYWSGHYWSGSGWSTNNWS